MGQPEAALALEAVSGEVQGLTIGMSLNTQAEVQPGFEFVGRGGLDVLVGMVQLDDVGTGGPEEPAQC